MKTKLLACMFGGEEREREQMETSTYVAMVEIEGEQRSLNFEM